MKVTMHLQKGRVILLIVNFDLILDSWVGRWFVRPVVQYIGMKSRLSGGRSPNKGNYPREKIREEK